MCVWCWAMLYYYMEDIIEVLCCCLGRWAIRFPVHERCCRGLWFVILVASFGFKHVGPLGLRHRHSYLFIVLRFMPSRWHGQDDEEAPVAISQRDVPT